MNDADHRIDAVKKLYLAFSKHDMNTMLGLLSDDVEWGEPENPFNPNGGNKKGHSGFLKWVDIGKNNEEILILEPKRFLCDHDSVAVIGYMKCLAKPTGKIYESDFVHLIVFKDGKIQKFQEFFDTYIAGESFR